MFWVSLLLGSWGSAMVMKWQVSIYTRKFVTSPLLQRRQLWLMGHPRKAAGLGAEVKKKKKTLAKKDKTTSDAVFTFGYRVHFSSGKTVSLLWLYELKWTQQTYKTWPSWEENKEHNEKNSENRRIWKVRETAKAKTIPIKCFWKLDDGRGKNCIVTDQPWKGKILRGPRNCKNYIYI